MMDLLGMFFGLVTVTLLAVGVVFLIGSMPSYLYDRINAYRDRRYSVEDKIKLQIKTYKPSHSERLAQQAKQEHDLGLHEDAVREAEKAWLRKPRRMLTYRDESGFPSVRLEERPTGCAECDRVRAGELCLCARCTPLWAGRKAA